MYHNFFIHSSVDGHLCCFRILDIVNSAAMNTGIPVNLNGAQITKRSGEIHRSNKLNSKHGNPLYIGATMLPAMVVSGSGNSHSPSLFLSSFSSWLTSLCIIGSRFIHLIKTDLNVFLFYGRVIFHCVYIYNFFIHSSVDGHLGCLHLLAIVNSAAVNIRIQCMCFLNFGFLTVYA